MVSPVLVQSRREFQPSVSRVSVLLRSTSVSRKTCQKRRDEPRPVAGADLAQGGVDEVDVVLLRNGAAVGRPGAVTDDGRVDLREKG